MIRWDMLGMEYVMICCDMMSEVMRWDIDMIDYVVYVLFVVMYQVM